MWIGCWGKAERCELSPPLLMTNSQPPSDGRLAAFAQAGGREVYVQLALDRHAKAGNAEQPMHRLFIMQGGNTQLILPVLQRRHAIQSPELPAEVIGVRVAA